MVPQASSLFWLVAGASLLGMTLRVTIPPFTWLALTFLLHASRSMPIVPGIACLWIALFTSLALSLRGAVPASGPAYFGIVAVVITTMALPFVLDRVAANRLGLLSTLLFPMAWVAAEFLRSRLTPATTWYSIAYTQYGFLPLMQLAALAGIWGIAFLVAWGASTLEMAWGLGFAWSAVRGPVLACSLVVGVSVIGGSLRLGLASSERASLRVATLNRPVDLFVPGEMTRIAEGRVPPDERESTRRKLERLADWFLEGSRREARAGARLVLWPEQNLLIFDADEPRFLDRARRLAADEQVYLAMGMGTVHPGERLPFENKLVLVDPSGQIVVSYLKSHPVSGWEASIMRVGESQLPVVATRAGRIAAAICFDADFPEFIRQAARGSAELLLLPVNEWRAIKDIHFQMHAFRAIENGMPLVRAAASGLSSAFDPWGRVLGVSDYFAEGDRTLTVQVPVGRIPTWYPRTGDLFAWICVVSVVVMLGAGAVSRALSGRQPPTSAGVSPVEVAPHDPRLSRTVSFR